MPSRYNSTYIQCENRYKRFITPERYDAISYLAKGSQGIVCKGWDNKKDKSIVIKHCKEPFSTEQHAKRFFREFVLSRIVNHRNIIKLEYAYTPESCPNTFTNMYLIFQYMDMNLRQFRIQESQRFNGPKGSEFIGILMHQFLTALKYLHQPNLRLIHRDLSHNNILIKKLPGHNYNYLLKLAYLGMARQLPYWDDIDSTKSIGTVPYRAPEICISHNYDTAVDLWSAGCILYELITGRILFLTNDQEKLLYLHIRMVPLKDEEMAQLSWHLQDNIILKSIDWTFDLLFKELQDYGSLWNQQRIGMIQYNDLIHHLLTFDPQNRITAEQALALPIWNYLQGCTFYNLQIMSDVDEMALPYEEEYGSIGSVEEWRERLFNRIVPLQAMININSD